MTATDEERPGGTAPVPGSSRAPRWRHPLALSVYLFLGLALVAGVPLVTLGLSQSGRSEAAARERADEHLRVCAEAVAREAVIVAEGHVKALETLAGQLDAVDSASAGLAQGVVALRARYGGFSIVYAADLTGHAVAADPPIGAEGAPVVGTSYTDRPYFQEFLRTGHTVVSGVEVGRHSGRSDIHILVPVLDRSRTVVGALEGSLDLDAMREVAQTVASHSPHVQIGIQDGHGSAIVPLQPGRPSLDLALEPDRGTEEPRSGKDGAGRPLRAAVVALSGPLAWTVVASELQSDIDAEAAQVRLRTLGTACASLALCLLLGALLAGWWARPIMELARSAADMARGVFSAPPRPRLGDPREVVALVEGFDDMARQIRAHTETLEEMVGRRTAELAETNQELERSMQTLRTAQSQLGLADRMASIGTLAAGVAHEINNPLAYIAANVAFASEALHGLATAGLPPGRPLAEIFSETLAALKDAAEGAERVKTIVRDLGVFSRADDHGTTGPVDVHAILDACVKMAGNEIRHRGVLEKTYRSERFALGNAAQLSQVFLNLIVNAAQALGEGGADRNRIEVSTADTPSGLEVAIRDTGRGIPPEHLARVFDPFFTTKDVGQGTGLGLAISHRIITSLGGTIRVESEAGRGTTFHVVLPFAASAPRPVAPAAAAPRTSARARVLLIDDEPSVLKALQRTLSPFHDVVPVSGAEDGLERLRAGERFDAILCDVMMPHMSGVDFYRELDALRPGDARRIIFVTGGAFAPEARSFLESVPNRVLEKPFSTSELRSAIASYL